MSDGSFSKMAIVGMGMGVAMMEIVRNKNASLSERSSRRPSRVLNEAAQQYRKAHCPWLALGTRIPTTCGSIPASALGSETVARVWRYSQFHLKVNPSNESNTLPAQNAPADPSLPADDLNVSSGDHKPSLGDVEFEVIGICVRAAQAFGVSRSLGEIFGLIFCARKPVNFDFVVRSLRISTGSASHGLRRMCKLGIIRSCYVPRDRRVHYVLETSLRGLVIALLGENLLVQLSLANEQIERLRSRLSDGGSGRLELAPQVELLASWNSRFRAALKPMLEALS